MPPSISRMSRTTAAHQPGTGPMRGARQGARDGGGRRREGWRTWQSQFDRDDPRSPLNLDQSGASDAVRRWSSTRVTAEPHAEGLNGDSRPTRGAGLSAPPEVLRGRRRTKHHSQQVLRAAEEQGSYRGAACAVHLTTCRGLNPSRLPRLRRFDNGKDAGAGTAARNLGAAAPAPAQSRESRGPRAAVRPKR